MTSNMPLQDRLSALRAEMKKRNIDGFFVPRSDEFHGEYVPACAERLAWITGFTGSAGEAVILSDKAGFYTDSRYTIQSRAQVSSSDFFFCPPPTDDKAPPPLLLWIQQNVKAGSWFGIDPWIHSVNEAKAIKTAVEKAGGRLMFLNDNPIDCAWGDRPAKPAEPVIIHPLEFSGISSQEKRAALAAKMKEKGADALAIALPEEICWLLNIRGNDVPHTPFALSYAIAHSDGTVDWFIDPSKITPAVQNWVGVDVRIHDLKEFSQHISKSVTAGKKIWIDPNTAPVKVEDTITTANGGLVKERSPIQLMKACKNAVEIQGTINAHIRDGVAETRFLAAISEQGAAAKLNEISASDLLEKFRREGQYFKDLSFDTISGAGGNGAIVHYRATPETCNPLTAGPIYLVDSGAQYLDGTTDITRTIAVGTVTPEMKEHNTRVLKGHIQVAMAVFPEGTTGHVLDAKARAALKEIGLDYGHGTGHGVGSYLSVHEGPCGISPRSTTVPLMPGMIISNEPGYYKENEYGIRIENLVLVIDTGNKDADGKKLLGFKTLTQAPIDRNLIEPALLSNDELKWLNDYHAEVQKNLLPLLEKTDAKAADFLKAATAPIHKPSHPGSKPMFVF